MSSEAREFSVSEVADQLRSLGVEPDGVLLVHTSYRAVRPVEDGPAGLIEALKWALGPRGTLVMPSETGDKDLPFDPSATTADPRLGIVPQTFWQQPGVLRSNHPFAFAARGLRAPEITGDPLILPPFQQKSPVGRVCELDGQLLLLGVGHDANTTLHLAETLAGVPYRAAKHFTLLKDGEPVRIDYAMSDSCCELFSRADGWLRAQELQSEGPVGHARARLMQSKDLVQVAIARLHHDPTTFLHPAGSGCADCDDAWKSVHHC
jgi:aminoglycoside N3'-acetyltransferase